MPDRKGGPTRRTRTTRRRLRDETGDRATEIVRLPIRFARPKAPPGARHVVSIISQVNRRLAGSGATHDAATA